MRTVPSNFRTVAALAALALGAAACSGSASGAAAAPPAAADGLPRLVFFMNPNGAPCQLQDQVIRGMAPELTGKITVVYLRTTVPAEIPFFERYGVRSLPQLLLVDGAGRELRRATPGVQQPEAIRRLVGI
jgi:thioredoxin 1